MDKGQEKIGLVIEGGGTKIGYTAGVIKCLLEHNIILPYAVGISSGAEVALAYVSKQVDRLEVTGVESASQPEAVGWKAFKNEGSIFGIEATCNYIEEKAPLDFEAFLSSETQLDIGVYDLKDHEVEYFGKEYVDESMTLLKASCALLLLAKPYPFLDSTYIDAGLIDMISIEQSIRQGCTKHLVLSTKEEDYVRKPAPGWQSALAKIVYKDKTVSKHLKERHIRYQEQWDKIHELEKEGKAMVLRPSKDLGVSRYTTDPEKLRPWFQLGYDETLAKIDQIREFCNLPKQTELEQVEEKDLKERCLENDQMMSGMPL